MESIRDIDTQKRQDSPEPGSFFAEKQPCNEINVYATKHDSPGAQLLAISKTPLGHSGAVSCEHDKSASGSFFN
jgi:hypothetical protein